MQASTFRDRCWTILQEPITNNGRELVGAVNRILAHSKLNGQPVTLELAEREVQDLIRPQEPRRVRIEDIQRVVARQYNVSRSDLMSARRTANVCTSAASGNVLGQDAYVTFFAGNRPPLWRTRSHHGFARSAQDRSSDTEGRGTC